MKRIAVVIGLLMLISSSAIAQTIIENPAKPDNPRAGRVITLKDEMRIVDMGEEFFIKYVFGLAVAPDGTILINDSGEQALQFDGRGRFVRNLMKKGQGPGELSQLFDTRTPEDEIVLCGAPNKIIIFSHDGTRQKEISLSSLASGFLSLISVNGTTFFFNRSGRLEIKGASGWKDIPQEILAFSSENGSHRVLGSFPMPAYVQFSSPGGVGVTSYQQFIAQPFGTTALLISHTDGYLIKLLDCGTGNLIRQFRRPYERIKTIIRKNAGIVSVGRPPTPEYWADIQGLHVVDGRIWVQTSTIEAKKGVLIDVFDTAGRYLDRFYLKWSEKDVDPNRVGQRFTFAGDFVYFADKTADDLVVIRKCRLIGL